AVDHHLVAGTDAHQIPLDDLVLGDLPFLAIADDTGAGLGEDLEVLQGPLRAELLDDAHRGVHDDQQSEGGVDPGSGGQHDHAQHTQHRVDAGEDVRADDL